MLGLILDDITVMNQILFGNMYCKLAAHTFTDDPKPVECAYLRSFITRQSKKENLINFV